MVRIIYSWKVKPKNMALFVEIWKSTTNKIHEEVKGARGSFMLRADKDPSEIKTIARWDSFDDWKKFWQEGKHSQMGTMHDLGERISVEVFEEVDDFTR